MWISSNIRLTSKLPPPAGFWGEKIYDWHYDLMFIIMNVVILVTDGGRWVLTK